MNYGFFRGVLSTAKQRQRFFWARNVTSMACAFGVFHYVGGGGVGIGFFLISLIAAYFTVAPIAAFIACFIEQLFS